ncbi:MAG TPA: hypothetical protein VGV35_14675 [Bryobacteraceae bacterium]|nr:hypothetical protein [Bryobacteraceae bacterium]
MAACVEMEGLRAMQTLYHAANGNVVMERTAPRATNHNCDGQSAEGTAG